MKVKIAKEAGFCFGVKRAMKMAWDELELNSDNLLVMMQGKDGYSFAGEGEIGVMLDTTITKELKEEGYLREVLSKVQNMRKESGFEVMDNIDLYVSGSKEVIDVIKANEQEIKKDTLALSINYDVENPEYKDMRINGLPLKIAVIKK